MKKKEEMVALHGTVNQLILWNNVLLIKGNDKSPYYIWISHAVQIPHILEMFFDFTFRGTSIKNACKKSTNKHAHIQCNEF